MGTNYYLHVNVCACCKRAEKVLHIGKSSAGWCFSLHVNPNDKWWDDGTPDLNAWKELWSNPQNEIRDEYGSTIDAESMLRLITQRSNEPFRPSPHCKTKKQMLERCGPTAMWGPNNLVRSKVDGKHCIGHGPNNETYDLIVGEFS